MIATAIVALSWIALAFAMAAALSAVLAGLLHVFAIAGGLLYGFQHDSPAGDRRHATHLLSASGVFALIAAASGSIALIIASFQ